MTRKRRALAEVEAQAYAVAVMRKKLVSHLQVPVRVRWVVRKTAKHWGVLRTYEERLNRAVGEARRLGVSERRIERAMVDGAWF